MGIADVPPIPTHKITVAPLTRAFIRTSWQLHVYAAKVGRGRERWGGREREGEREGKKDNTIIVHCTTKIEADNVCMHNYAVIIIHLHYAV